MSAAGGPASRAHPRAPVALAAHVPAPRHARRTLLLAVCCLAQFMVILDVSIVNVALPSIQRDLGFPESQLQWVVNAYTIAFAGFLMLSGRAADLFGGRRTFATGLLLFAAASLAGGTAADRQVLVGARALQGLGGAVMAASSLAVITSTFAPGPERHRAIALWGAMNGAGGAAGTLLGGIITQELSWRWVLLINLPIGIAGALVARAVIVDRPRGQAQGGFDLAGALSVTCGLLALVYGIVNAAADGWGAAATLGPIAAGLVLLALFVVIEGRFAAAPLVPLRVFGNRLLTISNLVVVVFSAALFPMWYFCSLYLQKVLHWGALDTGLAFLPMALTIMAFAGQAGLLVVRFGAGRVLTLGLGLMAAGLALFGRVSLGGSYLADFLVPSMLVSMGIGLSVVPSTIAATATAAPEEAGLASGLVNTSRQMGGALGLAVLASLSTLYANHLVNSDYRVPQDALDDGFRLAFFIAAGFALAGAAIAFRYIPRAVRPPAPRAVPDAPAAPAGPLAADSAPAAPHGAGSGAAAPHAAEEATSGARAGERAASAIRAEVRGTAAAERSRGPDRADAPERADGAPDRAYAAPGRAHGAAGRADGAPAGAGPSGGRAVPRVQGAPDVRISLTGGPSWRLAGGAMTLSLSAGRRGSAAPEVA